MLDKSLEFCYLIMTKCDTDVYPKYTLPDGYVFSMYEKGDEKEWAEIELSVEQFDTADEAIRCFNAEFSDTRYKPEERVVFVRDASGKAVATGSVWGGNWKGKDAQRLHWIAVDSSCVGKGIAKALVTKLMDIYNELGYGGFIYLITESWCYCAVNIYYKFGFDKYTGDNPVTDFGFSNEEFIAQNERGWQIVTEKINSYAKSESK